MNPQRRKRGDETWNRLLGWTEAQKASERLAGHILAADGFRAIDPSHPLGGPDNLKDIVCTKNEVTWVAAAYFPNGEQQFKEVLSKFVDDSQGAERNNAEGFAFVCNQYLTVAEREKMQEAAPVGYVEIYHLERIARILDMPVNYGLRLEFLDIEMTKEEQLAYFQAVTRQMGDLMVLFDELLIKLEDPTQSKMISREIENLRRAVQLATTRPSYTPLPLRRMSQSPLDVPINEIMEFESILNRITGGPLGPYVGYPGPPIRQLRVPIDDLREFEERLDRILIKLERINYLKRRGLGNE